ncbi:MAG: hypothetical protein M5U28_20105 [Sandaracinaceae bacterium]|nr:hypothetical protein [Sandaracinaceae bacterium]
MQRPPVHEDAPLHRRRPRLLARGPSAAAQAAPLVLVLEDESATVDVASLRQRWRPPPDVVVALGDERAAGASDSLAVASADGRRWTLRYDRGARSVWRAEDVARPEAVAETLVTASRALFALASAWPHVNGDVLDPFAPRWDPLADALRDELAEPFPPGARYASAEVVDPFAPPPAWSDLVDPWAD